MLSALGTSALLMTMPATSAQAAGQYYNCANANGCTLVDSKYFTSSYTKTQYPVVMAHGLGGFTKLFGVLDYFNGIPSELMKGGSEVYTTKTSAVNNSEVRGEQLLQQVKTITAISGDPKVNLFGHSQGGIDIRYVAGVAPKYVASVTAVSSPEQGSKTADFVKNVLEPNNDTGEPSNVTTQLVSGVFNLIGGFTDVGSGISIKEIQAQDGWQALMALSTDGAAKFNGDGTHRLIPPCSLCHVFWCGWPPIPSRRTPKMHRRPDGLGRRLHNRAATRLDRLGGDTGDRQRER